MSKPVSNTAIPNPNNAAQGQSGEQQNNSNASIDSLPHLVLARIFEFASRDQEGLETTAAIRSTSQKWKHINDETLLPNLYYHVKTALGNHPFFQTIPAFNAIMTATPEQMKTFALFKDLSSAVNEPCLLFPEQYLTAYQQLEDTSLVTVWGRIAQQINFHEDEPIPSEAQEIRNWINNPENAEKIQAITELDLSYMNLELLPQEMRAFVNLQCLNLSCNYLKSLPESIGDLRQLEWLGLAKNDLKSLPKSIGNLPLLTTLSLQNNHLESLPETIGNLSQIEQLSLENNNLISLPETIGNLSQL
ncbi:MAG: leucine-rich repeat domain-containing protein, partial [Verrucomicrobia bacterium]|nr:leucine-rich repeat domain-containing protein [Verrucomicrobiota bacterium]